MVIICEGEGRVMSTNSVTVEQNEVATTVYVGEDGYNKQELRWMDINTSSNIAFEIVIQTNGRVRPVQVENATVTMDFWCKYLDYL